MPVAAHPAPPPSPAWLIAFLIGGAFAGSWLFRVWRERGIMLRYTLYSGILAVGAVLAVAAYVAAYQHLTAVPGVPGSGWVLNWLIAWLIVGIYAGALAGTITQEGGYDLVGDIITGMIGALLGGLVGLAPGWHTFVDVILKAFIGACLLSGLKIALVYAVRGTRPHLPLSYARRVWTALLLLTPLIFFGLFALFFMLSGGGE
jgi:uncharacterized membrane protein YeaQ/YmgE (transglycosylase-associated protein family)